VKAGLLSWSNNGIPLTKTGHLQGEPVAPTYTDSWPAVPAHCTYQYVLASNWVTDKRTDLDIRTELHFKKLPTTTSQKDRRESK
jgi:hypothetical protein